MANYKFKTTNIRGKQYVEVNERIKFFRQEDRYKDWTIMSEFTVLDSEQCVCRTTIADATGRVIATGHAHEVQGASNINKTSYVENCETSAIGRALAMLGIGIDTSIASANEVTEAIAKQESDAVQEGQAGTREVRHGTACKHHGQGCCLHQVADRQEESIRKHHGQVREFSHRWTDCWSPEVCSMTKRNWNGRAPYNQLDQRRTNHKSFSSV